jgi:hypothetical protein
MASSSADCVLGVARLISSASTTSSCWPTMTVPTSRSMARARSENASGLSSGAALAIGSVACSVMVGSCQSGSSDEK